MSDQAITIHDVHKAYGPLHVLRGVELDVTRGTVFGLLGPNGAGKTTLIHTILGLLNPDRGTVRVFDIEDRVQLAARIGYLPERPRYHHHFTGREYMTMLGRLSNLHGRTLRRRVEAVIDLVGLSQSADRRIGEYSKGMMQRIGIAQAVLHKPELLVVDEPASGLDPGGQREMALLLRTLNDEGHTVFLCTHQLTEVARLCDRVGVLVNGRLDYTTSVAALHEQGHSVTIRVADLPAQTAKALYNLGPQVRCDRVSVTLFPVSDGLLASVLRRLLDDYVPIQAVTPEADALEQFYLGAIQGNLVTTTAQTTAFPEESFQTLYKDR